MADPARPRRAAAIRLIASMGAAAGRAEPPHRRRGSTLHVDLLGPVGRHAPDGSSFTAAGVLSLLARHGTAREIAVEIDSPGGMVDDALRIANALRKHPATVETTAGRNCLSAATLILAAGDRRYAYRDARILLHSCEMDPGAEARRWTATKFRETADLTARMDARMTAVYLAAGMRRAFVEAELRTESMLTLMTAELEGLLHGVAGGGSFLDQLNYSRPVRARP